MKKNIWGVLFMVVFLGLISSCNMASILDTNSLVGKWQGNNRSLEFFSNGQLVYNEGSGIYSGTYSTTGSDYINVTMTAFGGTFFYAFGPTTLKYQISNDTLNLQGGVESQSATFQRVKNTPSTVKMQNATTTPNLTTKTITSTSPNSPTIKPSVSIISPNGGEVWHVGDKVTIQWSRTQNSSDYVTIEISSDGGNTWRPLNPTAAIQIPNTGNQDWIVTSDLVSSHCKVKISSVGNDFSKAFAPVTSASDFTITK